MRRNTLTSPITRESIFLLGLCIRRYSKNAIMWRDGGRSIPQNVAKLKTLVQDVINFCIKKRQLSMFSIWRNGFSICVKLIWRNGFSICTKLIWRNGFSICARLIWTRKINKYQIFKSTDVQTYEKFKNITTYIKFIKTLLWNSHKDLLTSKIIIPTRYANEVTPSTPIKFLTL